MANCAGWSKRTSYEGRSDDMLYSKYLRSEQTLRSSHHGRRTGEDWLGGQGDNGVFSGLLKETPPSIRLHSDQQFGDRAGYIDRFDAGSVLFRRPNEAAVPHQLSVAATKEELSIREQLEILETSMRREAQDRHYRSEATLFGVHQFGRLQNQGSSCSRTPKFFDALEHHRMSSFEKKKAPAMPRSRFLHCSPADQQDSAKCEGRRRKEDRWTIIPPASTETVPNNGKGQVVPVSSKADQTVLTAYQAVIRESLEYFTATEDDVTTTVQGRRKPIMMNQLGIRCRYCSHLPIKLRMRASAYYPRSLPNLYLGAQNIACVHFQQCTMVPKAVSAFLMEERPRKVFSKGGRPYWAESCKEVGIYEDDNALWMLPPRSEESNLYP